MSLQAPLEHAAEAPGARSAEILVVDDNDGLRKVMRCVLEDAGYTVYGALDGIEVLDCLRTHGHGRVVLLDLNLPVLDGWGVLCAVA